MANWRIGALKEILASIGCAPSSLITSQNPQQGCGFPRALLFTLWVQMGKLRSGADGPAQLVTAMLSGSTRGFPGGGGPRK